MLLIRQDLSKAVGRLLICRDLLYVDLFVLDLLSKLVLINVNISKLGV